MIKRCDYGGSTQARLDEKMSRRETASWPFSNKPNLDSQGIPTKVSSAIRGVLKKSANKKRRQRDKVDFT